MIDDVYLMLYNLIFTSLPPLLVGIFDQNAPADLLCAHPRLYSHGRLGSAYRWYSFWIEQLDACWQSLAIFFTGYCVYYDDVEDLWSFGFLIMTALVVINQFHVAIEVQSWVS